MMKFFETRITRKILCVRELFELHIHVGARNNTCLVSKNTEAKSSEKMQLKLLQFSMDSKPYSTRSPEE